MLLLHDFPEFLCEHYYQFCDALPLIAHQLRNIVLSAFPKHMRCPDPFLVNFKVDMLNDISIVPVIAYNFSQNIQPPLIHYQRQQFGSRGYQEYLIEFPD